MTLMLKQSVVSLHRLQTWLSVVLMAFLGGLLLGGLALAATPASQMTLYPNGRAVVQEAVPLVLQENGWMMAATVLPHTVAPETLWVQPLGNTPPVVRWQWKHDALEDSTLLVTGQPVLYRDRTQGEEDEPVWLPGTLAFADAQSAYLLVQPQKGPGVVPVRRGEVLPAAVPKGLTLQPTLLVQLAQPVKAGILPSQVVYSAEGMPWSLHYQAIHQPQKHQVQLVGWLTLSNATGKAYDNVALQFITGNVSQEPLAVARKTYGGMMMAMPAMAPMAERASDHQAAATGVGESYVFRLPQTVQLPTKGQLAFRWLETPAIATQTRYQFDPNPGTLWWQADRPAGGSAIHPHQSVTASLVFHNRADESQNEGKKLAESAWGKALPAGVVRLYEPTPEGHLTLVGEDQLPTTPQEETITLSLGKAFDVLAEKRQTRLNQTKTTTEVQYEVLLTNRKNEPLTVQVLDHPYGEWTVLSSSMAPKERWQGHLRFDVPVPAKAMAKLTYILRTDRQ